MGTVDASRLPITRLERAECLALLEAEDVGRLAIVQGHAPAIFPVNYVLDGDTVVFRSGPGTKVLHGPRSLAAFEIDHLDRARRQGWSVVVVGTLEVVGRRDDPGVPDHLRNLPVMPWAAGDRDLIVRLVPGTITGRLIAPPPAEG